MVSKKFFDEPEMMIVNFATADIITASPTGSGEFTGKDDEF